MLDFLIFPLHQSWPVAYLIWWLTKSEQNKSLSWIQWTNLFNFRISAAIITFNSCVIPNFMIICECTMCGKQLLILYDDWCYPFINFYKCIVNLILINFAFCLCISNLFNSLNCIHIYTVYYKSLNKRVTSVQSHRNKESVNIIAKLLEMSSCRK